MIHHPNRMAQQHSRAMIHLLDHLLQGFNDAPVIAFIERQLRCKSTIRAINAPDAPAPDGGYAQAIETTGTTRRL